MTMILKGLLSTGLSVTYVLSVVLSAGAAPAGPLAQVIEGAKKEGAVTVKMRSGLTAKSMSRLEKEIRDKYGVNLRISFSPSASMPKDLSEAIMEQKAGAAPSYDLMNFLDTFIVDAMKVGVLERIDWKPLLTEGTNPKVVLDHPALVGAIVYYTGHTGLMYNAQKVSADEVPRTLSDLANPRWKGKVGVLEYEVTWARWAFILGKEKVLSSLRAILKNGAIRGRFVDLQNRFLLGEISFCFTGSIYLKEAQDKGMPSAWRNLDFAEIQPFTLSLRKGAVHPNAAKLVAVYMASPEGAKFMLEESGAGSLFYPGNLEHDISSQAKKEGIPEHIVSAYPGLIDFNLSEKSKEWEKEIKLIFDTVR
jgi:iron(III) transport system substrate-binding protein